MSEVEPKIAAATGVSVGGKTDVGKKVEFAMREVALNAAASGETDGKKVRAAMLQARYDAKPPERR